MNNTSSRLLSNTCRSMRVEECAEALGISRSSMYTYIDDVIKTGQPFSVIKIGNKILVSRKSFESYLASIGF